MNLFHGRLDGNRLRVGSESLPHADCAIAPGAEVVASRGHMSSTIVRDGPGASASRQRTALLSFGVAARVELEGTASASGQHFEVELTRERAHELDLRDGDAVRLVPSRLKVFESGRAESVR